MFKYQTIRLRAPIANSKNIEILIVFIFTKKNHGKIFMKENDELATVVRIQGV